jgi:hypothetical protein
MMSAILPSVERLTSMSPECAHGVGAVVFAGLARGVSKVLARSRKRFGIAVANLRELRPAGLISTVAVRNCRSHLTGPLLPVAADQRP